MIVGSGLLARAFAAQSPPADTVVYAAGVSNSSCRDAREFAREQERLSAALSDAATGHRFVYFSTCSVEDPEARASFYVTHKRAMEELVTQRARHLVLRLPQLAGDTPNPHTLLNYLYARIARTERFQIWGNAQRNIIDVDDVARIAIDLMGAERAADETINVANMHSASVLEIVRTMEHVLGRRAIFDSMDQGSTYAIDTRRIQASLQRCAITFSPSYLRDVIMKYYGHHV
jgi:nucleoside-diphosphate-sugar epimerase